MKPTPGKAASEKEKYWTQVIDESRRHPHGVAAYLREHGINQNSYYAWFKRLHPAHPEWDDLRKDKVHRARQTKAKKETKIGRGSTEVKEKPTRRTFSEKEKKRILDATDAAGPGEIAAILRREGLYSSTLSNWRKQRAANSLPAKKRGPKPDSEAARIKYLEQKVAKLEWKLKHKDALLDLQKKIAQILETPDEDDK